MTRKNYDLIWTGIHVAFLLLFLLASWLLTLARIQPGYHSRFTFDFLLQGVVPAMVVLATFLPFRRGFIDLSVTATAGASALLFKIVAGSSGEAQMPAFFVCLLLGLVVGVVNGVGSRFGRLAAVLVTSAVGALVSSIQWTFHRIGESGHIAVSNRANGAFYFVLFLTVAAAIAADLIFGLTPVGRRLGGAETRFDDTRPASLKDSIDTSLLFVVSAVIASLAGVVLAAQSEQRFIYSVGAGPGVIFAALLIGGVSLAGGKGSASLALFAGWAVTTGAAIFGRPEPGAYAGNPGQTAGYPPDYTSMIVAAILALFTGLYLVRRHFEPKQVEVVPPPLIQEA
jgi:ribose/xylose/arabinose/galactoside ABC-type transport system permease subunit